MSKVLIIGAGGVGGVVAQKCAAAPGVFSHVMLASRTLEKCEAIRARCQRPIETAPVDADRPEEVAALIHRFGADLVVNVALPFQDLSIMEACLETGAGYLDTANYEPKDEARFCYRWQWDYHERFLQRGVMATLGCGFDPGVTNVFCAHAQKHLFDEIHFIDIIDVNAGDHGLPFATNFNPEINIREITANGRYWEKGKWVETSPMAEKRTVTLPETGQSDVYLLYHEELESLALNIRGLQRIRFWMSFSEKYLTHLRVLQNVGMTSIEPVKYGEREIIPLQFLKALLPDPASLGPRTKGKTNIGCVFDGIKGGRRKRVHLFNVCDHQEAFRDVGSQAISYTTGVPAMIGAMLMAKGVWKKPGVHNVETLDPDPFMEELGPQGLPWQARDLSPGEIAL